MVQVQWTSTSYLAIVGLSRPLNTMGDYVHVRGKYFLTQGRLPGQPLHHSMQQSPFWLRCINSGVVDRIGLLVSYVGWV